MNPIDQASFRNVPFYIASQSTEAGARNTAVHQTSDARAYVEDLGSQPEAYCFQAYVIGKDCADQCDRLREACTKKGSGKLDYSQGKVDAICKAFIIHDNAEEKGIIRFTLHFCFAKPQYFKAIKGWWQKAKDLINQATQKAEAWYQKYCDLKNAVQEVVDKFKEKVNKLTAVVRNINSALDQFGAGINSPGMFAQLGDELGALLSQPATLANMLASELQSIQSKFQQVQDYFNQKSPEDSASNAEKAQLTALPPSLSILEPLLKFGEHDPTPLPDDVPEDPDIETQIALNTRVIETAVRLATCAQLPAILNDYPVTTPQELVSAETLILSSIDELLARCDTTTLPFVRELQQTLIAQLAELKQRTAFSQHTPCITQPALVLSHHLHGDIDHEAELLAINAIAHPGFVPGGQPLTLRG